MLIATVLAVILGVSIGVASAIRQYRLFDRVSNAISVFFLVCPTFVLALLLVLAGIRFNDAIGARWFYVTGLGTAGSRLSAAHRAADADAHARRVTSAIT